MAKLMSDFVIKNDQHMGHLLLFGMKRDPDAICQVDVAKGEKETRGSVLTRFVKLAKCFRKHGLKPGDVLALSGKNHLDVHIPYYAAVINGLPMCGVDSMFKYDEIKSLFNVVLPKIAFCDTENYEVFCRVVKDLGLDTTVVHFGEGENNMNEYMKKHSDDSPIDEFRAAEIDTDKVYVWLAATSGTTGSVKVAAIRHQQCFDKFRSYLDLADRVMKPDTKEPQHVLNIGPIHWLTGIFNALGIPLMNHVKVQTSGPVVADHLIDIINEYKPISLLTSPAIVSSIIHHRKPCDLSNFKIITVTGMKLPQGLYKEVLSKLSKGSVMFNMYAQTETLGPLMLSTPTGPENSFGMLMPSYEVKLVDPVTGTEVTESMSNGELWIKGPRFTEYYRNPEETAKAITEDGWYKTGDIFYTDKEKNYFYVERLKSLIKYRNYHVVPKELEELISTLPGVEQVAVTSIPHHEDGEHPVACVVKKPGINIVAKDINDLVASKLSENKKLRGGVIFLEKIPMTSTGKVALGKLKNVISEIQGEL